MFPPRRRGRRQPPARPGGEQAGPGRTHYGSPPELESTGEPSESASTPGPAGRAQGRVRAAENAATCEADAGTCTA